MPSLVGIWLGVAGLPHFLTFSTGLDDSSMADMKLIFQTLAVQYGSHESRVASECLKCGRFQLRCITTVKYTLNIKELVQKSKTPH